MPCRKNFGLPDGNKLVFTSVGKAFTPVRVYFWQQMDRAPGWFIFGSVDK